MSKYSDLKVGVLALQGDFECHLRQINSIGAKGFEVKHPQQLEDIDGLIIPGGESSTMNILIDRFELREPLIDFVSSNPVYGTCAGMIMLAQNINDNLALVSPLKAIDIDVIRNGYGRQVFSFETPIKAKLNNRQIELMVSFIRAPKISRIGQNVKVIASYNDSPVLVVENRILASSFHTELTKDTTLLKYFIDNILLD
ncbi:MAG: pyridoxal 5'-phosphate synthase glutaminase subunit PdxT [Candidatus Zixiibacteriota bacterium]|nr:MAG: pyridoxal 5'-phosphate synthase glutaminase subunit PdxT [candidate division Zixibacteria bacterium]